MASTTTPVFQHGKNAFLAIGYEAGTAQATSTSTASPLTIANAGGSSLLSTNQAMTPVGGGSNVYGVFMGDPTKTNGPVPLYGSALSSTAMTVTSGNVPTVSGTYNITPMVNISQWLNDISFPQAIEPQETTSFSAAGVKTYIVGLKGYSITFSGHYDATASGANYAGGLDAIIAGALAWQDNGHFINFVYGPATPGGFTGLTADMKYYGQGVLAKYDLKSAVNNIITFDGEIQVSGAIYRTTL